MKPSAGSLVLRGIQGGLAGAVALAVVLAVVAPPPGEAEERARKEASDALARSGLTPVADPAVVGERSLFDDPGGAVALALGCAAAGVVAGLALGLSAARRDGGLSDQLLPVVPVGVLLTLAGLAATGLLRVRELLASGAFWVVATAAVLLSDRAPHRRRPS